MSDKFWFLTSESLKKKVKSKWFIAANVILFFALVIIFNVDRVINFFGGDFENTKEIIVVDNTDRAFDILKNI